MPRGPKGEKRPAAPAAVVRRLLAKHPPCVLDPHFIRDTGPQGLHHDTASRTRI